jgi:hypothetical protein
MCSLAFVEFSRFSRSAARSQERLVLEAPLRVSEFRVTIRNHPEFASQFAAESSLPAG